MPHGSVALVPRVVVLANPHARWLRGMGETRRAIARARPGVSVTWTATLAALEEAARELVRERPDVVVLAGGDATYGRGVSALVRAFDAANAPLPAVALAPAGTTCTVARNWSVRGGGVLTSGERFAARATDRLLDAVATRPVEVVERPTLRVRDANGERLAFVVGAGLVARFFEVYEMHGAGGYRTAAPIVARVFAGSFVGTRLARTVLAPVPCEVAIDHAAPRLQRISLFVASVVRDLGLSMRLTYRAGEDPSRVHVVATSLGPRALGPQLPRVLAARPLAGDHLDVLASHARLTFPGDDGAWVVDGDLVRGGEVLVLPGPVVRVVALERR